jgi:cyclohexanecarboxylate-CoA ligase
MAGVCDPILPAQRVADTRARWPQRLLLDTLDDVATAHPDRLAVCGRSTLTGRETRMSYLQLQHRVGRIALGLAGLGVQPGDVVAWQLPNWWEFIALHLACLRVGAVSNPLMPIFRERELRFMLGQSQAKVLVVPREFRGHAYPAMVAGLRAELPALEHVLVVDGAGPDGFERVLLERRWEDELDAPREFASRRPSPDAVIQLLYTSGTTGEPKGVMHTSNTLVAGTLAYARALGLTERDVCYMASPLAHQTGFMYGMLMPLLLRTRVVLQDVWDARVAWELIGTEKVSFTMGATPFLADLTDAPNHLPAGTNPLRTFVCGGAPIPRVLARTANERLGVNVIAAWGMSECGVVTMTRPGDASEKIFGTDGVALPHCAVRVVDGGGARVPPDTEGRLEVTGDFLFVGYLQRPQLYAVRDGLWFDTGDLARMDADGYIRITGRAKDIIIRGGENVPVAEVEDILYRHPAVQDAAVVAMPDPRLGERACAFVALRPGHSLDLATLQAHFAAAGCARQYVPERLEIVPALPRTASGKIQKFVLRERAGRLAAA